MESKGSSPRIKDPSIGLCPEPVLYLVHTDIGRCIQKFPD